MKRILIVEDNADIRVLVRVTLEVENFEVREVATADEGWPLVQAWRPHLVLSDVMMPGTMDGFDLCHRIKADPDLAATKVVMLTALSQQRDLQDGADAGADDYVTKPFMPEELLKVLKAHLRR